MSSAEEACLLAFDTPRTREAGLAVASRVLDEGYVAEVLERLERRQAIVGVGTRLVAAALMRDPVRDLLMSLQPTAAAVETANRMETTQCPTS